MKKYARICLSALALMGSLTAYAQSSVTLYGSIDNGITYVNNQGGKSVLMEQGGVSKVNTLGFSGVEDLGAGRSALFKLENGYSSTAGTLGQGGLLFGKQAYVGLRDSSIGEITLGRQYDFTVQLEPYMPCLGCGIYAVQNADLDRIAGERLNNAVRFYSASFTGFSFGGIYSFAQNSGSLSTNEGRAYSAIAKFEHGAFSSMAVVTDINNAPIAVGSLGVTQFLGQNVVPGQSGIIVDNQRVVSVGALYHLGKWTPSFTYSNTRLSNNGLAATDQVLRVGTTFMPLPTLTLAGQLAFDRFESSRWEQINLGADYFLSARTDVYVDAAAQRASGPGTVASVFLIGQSSTTNQMVFRVGMKHLF
ncbi:outer membrane protein OmpU [Paraburkholderia eburnea]|uniref:Outer membrane protein OmpU n=1 Tax=Paraburkholderia eburnea TaxID=1189126 RepID=A0A2S4LX15_9BURK|nr:porin [Paraburkholderia eburnea]POR46899.1 outer membrane protein OmpU [Paraburkholderia eburnea]PRZ18002.1 outer membrane protein OmpU [Paraburkholderia eburnea]